METLLLAQHRNQHYGRSRGHNPSKGFRGINCRTFQSGTAIFSTPVAKHSSLASPKTPSPSKAFQTEPKHFRRIVKSGIISLPIKFKAKIHEDGSLNEDSSYSELWAGPAYSNSPSPSSLPIPKFSLHPQRTMSLELPLSSASFVDVQPTAKSAPPSPLRDRKNPSSRDLFYSAESATKTLRRILNLDISDE